MTRSYSHLVKRKCLIVFCSTILLFCLLLCLSACQTFPTTIDCTGNYKLIEYVWNGSSYAPGIARNQFFMPPYSNATMITKIELNSTGTGTVTSSRAYEETSYWHTSTKFEESIHEVTYRYDSSTGSGYILIPTSICSVISTPSTAYQELHFTVKDDRLTLEESNPGISDWVFEK